MQLNPVSFGFYKNNQTFRTQKTFCGTYFENQQDKTHDIIRNHLLETLGYPQYADYAYQIRNPKYAQFHDSNINCEKSVDSSLKKEYLVDSDAVFAMKKNLNVSIRERRANEIYCGKQLSNNPEALKALKEAGIKTVICLVPYLGYKENAQNVGLNFTDLNSLGARNLSAFDISKRGQLLPELINRPESYSEDYNDKISDLKKFVKILNGEDENYPLPIYIGCQNGTDRTFYWLSIYNILKDEDPSKPLSSETVYKLADFYENIVLEERS